MEGAVCSHFHWQRDYLLWGISWVNVQLMLADMPSVDYGEDRVVDTESEEAARGVYPVVVVDVPRHR